MFKRSPSKKDFHRSRQSIYSKLLHSIIIIAIETNATRDITKPKLKKTIMKQNICRKKKYWNVRIIIFV